MNPFFGYLFVLLFVTIANCFEVQILWNWSCWLRQRVLQGRPACLLNLDETSVSFAEARRCGNVVRVRKGFLNTLFYERITRRETHGHLTLVGLLSAVPEWQGFMPQLLLTKDGSLTVAEKAALQRLQSYCWVDPASKLIQWWDGIYSLGQQADRWDPTTFQPMSGSFQEPAMPPPSTVPAQKASNRR